MVFYRHRRPGTQTGFGRVTRGARAVWRTSQVAEYERVDDVASEIEREQRQARHEATGFPARDDEPGQLPSVAEARPRMGTSSRRHDHGEPPHRRSGPSTGPNSWGDSSGGRERRGLFSGRDF